MRSPKLTWQQSLLQYLVDNIFDFLAIGAAAYVVVRHQFSSYGQEDLPELITWLIAVLGLLTISAWWERHRTLRSIEEVSAATNEVVMRRLSGPVRASDFFLSDGDNSKIKEMSKAQDIWVTGMVLSRALRDHLELFGDRVATGADLRFVLLDHENPSIMSIMPFRSYGRHDRSWWRERIEQAFGHIEDIPIPHDPPGSITVGYLPYFPSFGMWLVDPDTSHGTIFVEIYHHRTAEKNPSFVLRAAEDGYWYAFFRRQVSPQQRGEGCLAIAIVPSAGLRGGMPTGGVCYRVGDRAA